MSALVTELAPAFKVVQNPGVALWTSSAADGIVDVLRTLGVLVVIPSTFQLTELGLNQSEDH
jgi:hypothetical protein